MTEALKMLHPTTSEDTPSVISSPDSEYGLSLSGSQAGLTPGPSGRVPVLASLSARQAKDLGLMTSGIYGPLGSTLSPMENDPMYQSMVSRLQARVSCHGSTLYGMTWKRQVTGSGRSFSLLRVSAPRSSGKERSGWPAPQLQDTSGGGQAKRAMGETRHGSNLNDFVMLAGWVAPMAQDHSRGNKEARPQDTGIPLSQQVVMAGWSAPTTPSGGQTWPEGTTATGQRPNGTKATVNLEQVSMLAGWASPARRDYRSNEASEEHHQKRLTESRGKPLSEQVHQMLPGPARLTAGGALLTGSDAEMTSGGQLNPEHSLWLMGIPREFLYSALQAMQSALLLRRNSSKPRKGGTRKKQANLINGKIE